jgi:hypothetical protein
MASHPRYYQGPPPGDPRHEFLDARPTEGLDAVPARDLTGAEYDALSAGNRARVDSATFSDGSGKLYTTRKPDEDMQAAWAEATTEPPLPASPAPLLDQAPAPKAKRD